jgi:hypothetical protein
MPSSSHVSPCAQVYSARRRGARSEIDSWSQRSGSGRAAASGACFLGGGLMVALLNAEWCWRVFSASPWCSDLQALVARSTTLQSEAGHIDARPQRRRIDEILLRQPDHTFGSKTVSMARERPGGFTPVTGLYPTACVAAAPIRPSPQRADECISPLFQWPRVRQTRP